MTAPDNEMGMHEASRREKLQKIEALGIDPYGSRFDDHASIGEIRARDGEIVSEKDETGRETLHGPTVRAAGRVMLQRKKGKLIFVDIEDWIMQTPNLAAKRAIMMGAAIGGIATALRVILGLERDFLGGDD